MTHTTSRFKTAERMWTWIELRRQNSWQQARPVQLYSDHLQAENYQPWTALDSQDRGMHWLYPTVNGETSRQGYPHPHPPPRLTELGDCVWPAHKDKDKIKYLSRAKSAKSVETILPSLHTHTHSQAPAHKTFTQIPILQFTCLPQFLWTQHSLWSLVRMCMSLCVYVCVWRGGGDSAVYVRRHVSITVK